MQLVTIRVLRDGKKVKELQADEETYIMGRDRSCDLVLDDRTASRRHASLEIGAGGVFVEDLGSRNGTYVSGKRITRQRILAGDVIQIGGYKITFEGIPAAEGISTMEPTARPPEEERPAETAIISALDAASIGKGEDVREGKVGPEAMAQRLSALYELGQELCGSLEVSEIADSFLDLLLAVFGKADRAVMLLEDQVTRQLTPFRVKERGSSASHPRVSQTIINTVLGEKHAVLCGDTSVDARFKNSVSLQDLRIKSVMCVPLLVTDKVLGMIEVDSGGSGIAFDDDDLRLLTGLSSQVSIAIENAKLYKEIESSKRLAAIGQTVSGVAHCVKNVLNGIEGGLFIARRGLEVSDNAKTGKGWDMLERNSTFLKALVLDMLDYSKDRPPAYESISLADLFQEILAFVEGRAAEGGIALTLELDPEIGAVSLDSKRMKRALLNIVGNAIEATPEGGKVEISAVPGSRGDFTISIADTGKGIPEEMIATIFEPFFSTKGSKGTGLGLPVTKKIIEEHGGKIEVTSVPDQGTTFAIMLPVGSRDSDGTRPPQSV